MLNVRTRELFCPATKKQFKVGHTLYNNTDLILPMVVEEEHNLLQLRESLKSSGYSYSESEFMEYLTSDYFWRRLASHLKKVGLGHVNPEYYIELYTWPT